MEIGFIGVGQMGFHMARRLVEAGHRVFVFDTRSEPVDQLGAIGARICGSARAVADEVETVMASLPTPISFLRSRPAKSCKASGCGGSSTSQPPAR